MKHCIRPNKTRPGKRIRLSVLLLLLLLGSLWILWGNITVKTTYIQIHDSHIPTSFDGFRIAQISDLHNAEFGANNSKLIQILTTEQPDMIVLTGDLVDSSHTDLDIAISFVQQAVTIAPCYYVTGNHEAWLGSKYNELEAQLRTCGVEVLRNQSVMIQQGNQSIQLIGIDDPDFSIQDPLFHSSDSVIYTTLQEVDISDGYSILLSHRPEAFEVYVDHHINLALCGHAHGGQFRLPFVGGIVAPNQGLFPKYDAGLYSEGMTNMVVSRGIGNSIIPVRVNNRPEVVIVSLHNTV